MGRASDGAALQDGIDRRSRKDVRGEFGESQIDGLPKMQEYDKLELNFPKPELV